MDRSRETGDEFKFSGHWYRRLHHLDVESLFMTERYTATLCTSVFSNPGGVASDTGIAPLSSLATLLVVTSRGSEESVSSGKVCWVRVRVGAGGEGEGEDERVGEGERLG
ncbi:hypothetical protein O3P69_001739 [Scylla paramamosain]|uniref:Uncharacterized protein n=1 Tax=Scylla paramamosain TaxID=85552 RepID=A0AAW0UZF4_SCYPA